MISPPVDFMSDVLASQMPNFFKTDTAEGLTQDVADAVEKYLSYVEDFLRNYYFSLPIEKRATFKESLIRGEEYGRSHPTTMEYLWRKPRVYGLPH